MADVAAMKIPADQAAGKDRDEGREETPQGKEPRGRGEKGEGRGRGKIRGTGRGQRKEGDGKEDNKGRGAARRGTQRVVPNRVEGDREAVHKTENLNPRDLKPRRGEKNWKRGSAFTRGQVRRSDGLFDPLGLCVKHISVDGLCYVPNNEEENIKNRELFTPRPDDCLVASYPRSGTTWTLEIVRNIHLVQNPSLGPEHLLRSKSHAVSVPWINNSIKMKGVKLDERASPRVFKTHNHYQHLNVPQGNRDVKVIHVMRDPKDVLCSQYFQVVKPLSVKGMDFQGTFQDYVGHFLGGKVSFGSYWKFNRHFLENKDGFNILYLTYEDLSRDKITCIKKISEFLGYKSISMEQIEAVDKPTRFEAMKGSTVTLTGPNVKGKVGRSKEMLSVSEELEILKQTKIEFALLEDKLPSSYFSD